MTLPLILPILGWIAAILIGSFGIAGFAGAFDDPKKNKLGVLGMQASGKTFFLNFLRNIPFIEGQTNRQTYESFKYKLSNGKEITIASGIDIGGGNLYRVDYNNIIEKSDVLLYLFDLGKYLKDSKDFDGQSYQRNCNSRFEHIFSKVITNKKPTLIIATHKDKIGLPEYEMVKKFNTLVKNKKYKAMLETVELVNLTDDKEIKSLADKIFKTN
jgi:hypothetical protein